MSFDSWQGFCGVFGYINDPFCQVGAPSAWPLVLLTWPQWCLKALLPSSTRCSELILHICIHGNQETLVPFSEKRCLETTFCSLYVLNQRQLIFFQFLNPFQEELESWSKDIWRMPYPAPVCVFLQDARFSPHDFSTHLWQHSSPLPRD